MPNFFVDIRQDLVYAYSWPSRHFRPIWNVKRAPKRAYPSFWRFSCAIAHHSLGVPDSTSKMPNFFVDVRQDLFYAYGWPSHLVRPIWKVKRAPKRVYPSFQWFSCAIANHFLGDPDSDVKNAKFLCGRPSRPCLCIRLAITARPTHLEGQTRPEASIPLISMIFVCYSKPFFGWSGFRRQKCQNFLWKSFKTFSMQLVGPHSSPTHFEGKTSPEARIPLISMIFVCYSKPFSGLSRFRRQ